MILGGGLWTPPPSPRPHAHTANPRASALSLSLPPPPLTQVKIMAALNHPNVVRYYDSFLEGNQLQIIMEYCDAGDLQKFLKKSEKEDVLPREDIIWKFFLQICIALQYLHSQRILHRDIKSANIFMTRVRGFTTPPPPPSTCHPCEARAWDCHVCHPRVESSRLGTWVWPRSWAPTQALPALVLARPTTSARSCVRTSRTMRWAMVPLHSTHVSCGHHALLLPPVRSSPSTPPPPHPRSPIPHRTPGRDMHLLHVW